MKAAKVKDLHRHLTTKKARWTSTLNTFSIKEIPSLGSIDIPFTSPFTVICGPNGVGKSTLLTALRLTLEGDVGLPASAFSRKLTSGNSYLALEADGESFESEVSFNNGVPTRTSGDARPVVFISTGETIFLLQNSLCEFDSREDLINGAGTKELNKQELEQVNYILKRDYRRVALSEVELDGIVPFFEVSYGDDDYDSRTMGIGELSALYIWWDLTRAEKNSFILLEEPETFLSPATQEAMANFFLSEALSKGHCITITSHSAAMIAHLPPSSLKFIFRAGGALQLSDPPNPSTLEKLGIKSHVNSILLVEDAAAETFLKLLLELVDPILSATVVIKIRDGHGGITRTLREVAEIQGPIRFIGVYDGDMRTNDAIVQMENAFFLPGDEAIEACFKKLVTAQPDQLAAIRGVADKKVLEILSGAEGADLHDWYHAICAGLGLSREQLLASIFVLWQREPGNNEVIENWYSELLKAL